MTKQKVALSYLIIAITKDSLWGLVHMKSSVPALERGLSIIEVVAAASSPLGFAEIVAQFELPTATAARILKVLQERGYVHKSPDGGYVPGEKINLCDALQRPEAALLQKGNESLKALCQATGNTAILLSWDGARTKCLAKHTNERSLVMQAVGNVEYDLSNIPWGWVVACFLPDDVLERSREYMRFPQMLLPHRETFRRQLAEAGYLLLDQEETMVRRLSSPVFDAGGRLVGALGVGGNYTTIPADSMSRIGRMLSEQAELLSRRLGCADPVACRGK